MAILGISKMIYVVLIILFIVFVLNVYLFYHFPYPNKPSRKRYDTALVLGCPCQSDGSLTDAQIDRMNVAISLYRRNWISSMIISGSNVQNDYYESEEMAAYAIDQGIPEHAIIIEKKARNTYENLKYAKDICTQQNFSSIIVITSPFHVRRANFFVRKFFQDAPMRCSNNPITFRQHVDEYVRMWNTLYFEWKLKK